MGSSSTTLSLHLAMAALVGASLMAISAFYIHKRSVDQVLQRMLEIRGKPYRNSCNRLDDDEDEDEDEEEDEEEEREDDRDGHGGGFGSDGEISVDRKAYGSSFPRSLDEKVLQSYRISSSLPNVAWRNDWLDHDPSQSVGYRPQGYASSMVKINSIPLGLPPLQVDRGKGGDAQFRSSDKRLSSVGRGDNALESAEDSDEEGTELDDIPFNHEDLDSSTKLIKAHGLSSNICNLSAVPLRGNDGNYMHQMSREILNEAKSNGDIRGDRMIDSSSVHVLGGDLTYSNSISSMCKTMHESLNREEKEVRKMICECLDLRKKYIYRELAPWKKESVIESSPSSKNPDPFHFEPVEATAHHFRMEDGVIHVYASENDTEELFPVASSTRFFTDMHHILKVMSVGNVRSTCHHRLRFLEEKFRLHLLVNADREFLAQKSAPHRDFYNIRKVDTHVHHSACMNQKHLLSFIKSKLRKEPDEVVIFRDGKYMTLKEVFESLDLTGYDLNVDLLDVHADKSTFHRFDKFNLKYNPCGQSRLREIFLKQDNLIQGRYLAEMAEYRISVYGRKQSEWDQLASWFVNNAIYSENAVWLIQLPRLYNVYKNMGIVTSLQTILDNVFIPLFEATVDPNSHPQLHLFLMQVVGFDVADDESKPERRPTKHMPTPAEWTNEFNPAYSYYAYYCYANLYTLNKLRESKGMPTIKFRPHCGEAGDIDHLAAAFLLCHNISHGINLRKSPVLQYLNYLAQVGLAMSPLSNNSLFLDYHPNPMPMFFQRGLNISLSSDDPLQIHLTKEALLEEYSVATQVWKLSACDLCEIARNSVYQSGFSHVAKLHWLGDKYLICGPERNDIDKTNVPHLRIAFRYETWKEEMQYVYSGEATLCRY
ncbi:AMP deaminase-like [Quillaja saponaria]|uniref:AMP deaminase n=1 Tax=Quillaja saponaria TaxID=32244 RepID=A0AAD7KRC7_QUISA|nr:AMP deaminase-like [Quillaja saponaria]